MAAGIHTITTETVHKSIFALAGHAVPVGAFAVFVSKSPKLTLSAVGTRSL
ncbi:hypothetical protein BH10ACI4_BH10ACI4_19170 [soil metagenome]